MKKTSNISSWCTVQVKCGPSHMRMFVHQGQNLQAATVLIDSFTFQAGMEANRYWMKAELLGCSAQN